MPTLDDLHEVLAHRAESCADVPVIAPAAVRRRSAAPLLAAAVVVAVVLAGAGVAALWTPDATRTAGTTTLHTSPPRWRFTIGAVPGWTAMRDLATWGVDRSEGTGWSESATLVPTNGRARLFYGYQPAGSIAFPGNGVGSQLGRADAVRVNGRQGWFVQGRKVSTADMTPQVAKDPWRAVAANGDGHPQLAWRNGDGSWSELSGTAGFRPASYDFDNAIAERAMLRIARAVTVTDDAGPVTMPLYLSDARLTPIEVGTVRGVSCIVWATVEDPPADGNSSLTICRTPNSTLHGSGIPTQDRLTRDLGDGTTLVAGYLFGGIDRTTERQLLDRVDVTPALADATTWLPVQ